MKKRMSSAKVVIVTGGSRGMGYAIAETLLVEGYRVYICGRDEFTLKQAVRKLSKKGIIKYFTLDLADKNAVRQFTKRWATPLYALVNNAGIVEEEPLHAEDTGSWERIMGVNLSGVYYLTKGLVGHLKDGGRIINIASQLGKEGRAGLGAYCASKFGLIGLTKSWAKELGERDITVNAVCPGWVETEMGAKDIEILAKKRDISSAVIKKQLAEHLELKRFNKPKEVADIVAFLLSKKASGISGRDWLMSAIWTNG